MRLKITLTLLIILLGLLTYIFYIDPWSSRLQLEGEDDNALASLAVDIDYLRIYDNAKNRALTLEKTENDWMLTEPFLWQANTFAVERILTQLQFLDTKVTFAVDRIDQTGSSLAEYGLAPPSLTLEFGSSGSRYSIGIGKATDLGNHLYLISFDKTKIHVVDRSLLDSLSIDIESLRSPRIFRSNIFEVDSWNLQLQDNLRTRVTKNENIWTIETPINTRADSIEVNTLLGKLLELKSLRVLQPTPADLRLYGLQQPSLRIAIESDQSREALEVGNPISPTDPLIRYGKLENRNTVFEIELDYLPELEKAQTNLRDRRIFEIDTAYATSVSFEKGGSESFSLQKLETDEWEILIPDEEQGFIREKGSNEAVKDALDWLNKVKAIASPISSGFVHDAPTAADLETYGLEVPEYSIHIASGRLKDRTEESKTPKVETLLFGDLHSGDRTLRYVKLAESDFVYLVSNDILEMVPDVLFQYQSRRLYEIPGDATINKLSITRLSNEETLLDTSIEDSNLPLELVDWLTPLEVKSYLFDQYTSNVSIAGKRQSWAYLMNVTFQWASADTGHSKSVELYVSELTGGPLLLGGSIDRNSVFEFRQPFIDGFSSVVFDRIKRPVPEEPFDSDLPLPSGGEEHASPDTEQQ